jgi:hypothetical protein
MDAASAHCPHVIVWPIVAAARFTESGFAAIAVMNIPEVTVEVWNTVVMTYAPIFFSVPFSGSEPHATQSAFVRGRKIPPARAAREGIAGARIASENTSEYVSPRVDFPKMDTMMYAILFPRPVLMNPLARKNAIAMSHGISDENAEKAAAKGRRPVTMLTARPTIAVAPSGRGCDGRDRGETRQYDPRFVVGF